MKSEFSFPDQIDLISLPTPFDVGDVNCYVLSNDELTLIDPGPDMESTYNTLKSGLDDLGFSISDVDNVLVTHPHLDHFGLAQTIKDESGADIHAHSRATRRISNFEETYLSEREFFEPFMERMGMPGTECEIISQLPESFTNLAPPTTVDYKIQPEETLNLGFELQCIDSPGHSIGGCTFFLNQHELAFTGDHVLSEITPNALLQYDASKIDRTRSLIQYMNALDNLREHLPEKPVRGLTGHGPPIDSLQSRIGELQKHHHDRKRQIYEMLDSPITAYELMSESFPNLPIREYFLGMSEVIGHLDVLEKEGLVERQETKTLIKYQRVNG